MVLKSNGHDVRECWFCWCLLVAVIGGIVTQRHRQLSVGEARSRRGFKIRITVVSEWCYSGITVVVQWSFSGRRWCGGRGRGGGTVFL
jgi:hypothetical protein